MRIREMLPSDLQFVTPLYLDMIEEAKRDPGYIPYPRPIATTAEEFNFFILEKLRQDRNFYGVVAIEQGPRVVKGFLLIEMLVRRFLAPFKSAVALVLYVDPSCRERDYANNMIGFAAQWCRENGATAFEAAYVPGTASHKLFASIGIRSYVTLGVLADENWKEITHINPKLRRVKNGLSGKRIDKTVSDGEGCGVLPVEGELPTGS